MVDVRSQQLLRWPVPAGGRQVAAFVLAGHHGLAISDFPDVAPANFVTAPAAVLMIGIASASPGAPYPARLAASHRSGAFVMALRVPRPGAAQPPRNYARSAPSTEPI